MAPTYLADMMDLAGDEDGMSYDDMAGDDDEMGAAFRRQMIKVKRRPLARLMSKVPGVPARGGRQQPFPIGTGVFVAASPNPQTFPINPLKPFKGHRLVTTTTRTGASATGLLTITQLFAGMIPQQATLGALPFEAFAPNAFGIQLSLDPLQPGVTFQFQVTISVLPGAADRVDFSAMIIGETLN